MSPSSSVATPTSVAIESLEHLEQVLDAEACALTTLDFRAIDQATLAKEQLEAQLATSLASLRGGTAAPEAQASQHREHLDSLRTRLRTKAQHNQILLEATLRSVRGLVGALLSDAPKTYGRARSNAPAARPVLTSAVG